MAQLTPEGQNFIRDIAQRYSLSPDSAVNMLIAVNNGGGTMAQFFCPELGSGQWMQGGMTMVSDMFNHSLKATVNNLCQELSQALATRQLFAPAPSAGSGGGNSWWPVDLGHPSTSGSQNNLRYAWFPQARRLAVQRDGQISVFDTMDHAIGGVSQQQGSNESLTFSSQYGTFTTLSLPLVSGPGLASSPAPGAPPAPSAMAPRTHSLETIALLEKLGQLRDAGVLSTDEFNAKKAELLARL